MAEPTETPSETQNEGPENKSGDDNKTEAKEEDAKKERRAQWKKTRDATPLKVEVAWLDFNHFKNRYTDEEGHAIIEVLRGHQALEREIRQEISEREEGEDSDRRAKPKQFELRDEEETWVHRVRIQSPQLLILLSRLTGHGDSWENAGPRVFSRPFVTFYYTLAQVKECLKILEDHWSAYDANASREDSLPVAGLRIPIRTRKSESTEVSQTLNLKTPLEATTGSILDSVIGLRHVRKYVEFVEETLLPLWDRAGGMGQRQVNSANLWMSFKIGELIYIPSASENTTTKSGPKAINKPQKIWRVLTVARGQFDTDPFNDVRENTDQLLDLWCYYVDFNGTSYEPYIMNMEIPMFAGTKEITTLPAYPLRFHKNPESVLEPQRKIGESFVNVLKLKYMYYDGWTLAHEPADDIEPSDDSNGEYIDSQVIIDFAQGHKTYNDLGGKSPWPTTEWEDSFWSDFEDTSLPIKHWNGESSSEIMAEVPEVIQRSENMAARLWTSLLERSKFWRSSLTQTAFEVEPDDYVLLPRRAIGYSLRDRKFLRLNVELLKPIVKSEHVFRDLKIDEHHKRIIRALIKTHFEKQKPSLDLIQGKGSGLVILLHGAPGVGKTATAEAVAQANNKPLFVITCGHLGFEPSEVEENLRQIFRLAHVWDCVLLLDEADVFLARRDLVDLKRNALVSVFLRVLEYYSGILFLTTNRVGIIDEAFKSRIHISLHYAPLSKAQTLSIFETNIRKLRQGQERSRNQSSEKTPSRRLDLRIDHESILDYAEWHYDNLPDHRWNGRQIRNAFQTASSFAQFDMWRDSADTWQNSQEDSDSPKDEAIESIEPSDAVVAQPVLDWRHFQLVADTVTEFDQYLIDAIGESDVEAASSSGLRADTHDPSQWNNGPSYSPQARRFERHDYGTRSRNTAQRRGGSNSGYSIRDEQARYRNPVSAPTPMRSFNHESPHQNTSQRGGRPGPSRSFTPRRSYGPTKGSVEDEVGGLSTQSPGRRPYGPRGYSGPDHSRDDLSGNYESNEVQEDRYEGYDDDRYH